MPAVTPDRQEPHRSTCVPSMGRTADSGDGAAMSGEPGRQRNIVNGSMQELDKIKLRRDRGNSHGASSAWAWPPGAQRWGPRRWSKARNCQAILTRSLVDAMLSLDPQAIACRNVRGRHARET